MGWGVAALCLACTLLVHADAIPCQASTRLQGLAFDLQDGGRLVVEDGCSFSVVYGRQGTPSHPPGA